jgi:hypothetical protein
LASTASVADSVIAEIRAEILFCADAMTPIVASPGPLARSGHALSDPLMIVNRADAALMPIGSTGAAGHRRLTYPVLTHWVVGACLAAEGRTDSQRAVAQLARVPVSKTGGWGFESLLPCECGP